MDDSKKVPARKLPDPPRKKRRLLKAVVLLGLVLIGLVVGLPWLLGTPPARALIVSQVNARLAPGSIKLSGLGLSWTGSNTLVGVALVDPKGKTVLAANRVTLDRGILELLASRPNYGTVTIEGATVDVVRRADGSIDLLDALASVMKPEKAPLPAAPPVALPAPSPSTLAVTVVVKGGTLKVVSPELVEPLTASTLDGSVTIVPGKPMELVATLGDEGRSLDVRSAIDGVSADRTFSLVGKAWPIHVRQAGVEAKGRLDGTLEGKQAGGLWSAKGDAALGAFEAAGPALQGDRLAFDRVVAACDFEQSAAGWTVRKLDLTCPVASLRGSGTVPATVGSPAELRGKVDLAALAKLMPNAMRLRDGLTLDRGTATIRADVTTTLGIDRLELVASLDDFAATEAGRAVRLREPMSIVGKATRGKGKVAVETLEVKAAGVDVTGSGDLEAGVKLAGTVDLVTLMAQLRDVLDLGKYDLSGHARLAADYRHAGDSFKGRFAVECTALKVTGATAAPIDRERVRLDGWAIGKAKPDGLPDGWQQARLDLKAGDLKLDVLATQTGDNADLVASFEMMVASPVPGRLDARAKFRRKSTVVEVDELTAGITPTDPKAASGTVALAIKGRFDSSTGAGTFGPIPGYAVGAIGLGPEGAKVSGIGRPEALLQVDAALVGDLAALDHLLATWNGAPMKGLGGLWSTRAIVVRTAAGKVDFHGKFLAPDVTFTTPRGPVSLAMQGGYLPEIDRLDVTALDLETKFGRLALVGGMIETQGRKLMDLKGTVEPNWETIDPILASSAGPSARFRATSRTLHLAGQLQADSTPQLLGQLFGEVGLDVTEAHASGVTMGSTPVVLRMRGGLAKFDPIATTLNGGPVSIIADLALDADNGVWMRFGSFKVEGAAINEEVSNALLSYVAPVLAKSSSVSGKVTVVIDRATVPITATGPLALDGAIAFQNVVFQPGTFATELNAMTGQTMHNIKLDEAMFIKVADGRVFQKGLSIPLGGNGLKVAMDGSVGFDQTLDLKATVPLTAKALGVDAGLDKFTGGKSVTLPIQGTLNKPVIDRNALRLALRDAARSMGEQQIKSEAGRFLDRIAGPNQGSGEPRTKPSGRNPLGDLENLGREILDPKKP